MKQVLQNLKDGSTEVAEVPVPRAGRGQLLIKTSHTLISAGTERMLVEFGKAGLLEKARQQPDKVRQVFDKMRTDGVLPTIESVRNKLDRPLEMGYCNVGVVVDVGAGVVGFECGDRVASNGKHAEYVSVPTNLCAKIPHGVPDEDAAFTVLGAIALQGIRLAAPTLGETVVVTGLGIIGLITVQLLRAQGCRILAIDFDAAKLALARRFGAEVVDLSAGEDPVAKALEFSRLRGVDAVIVTAATRSSEPMHQAALMCRKRGRIIMVGMTGLKLSRADFYEKELTFQVSCSYGPGRYDPNYEEKGQDYPVGFVRWTEQRNFEAVLDLASAGQLSLSELVSHRFAVANAAQAYAVIAGNEPSLAILLTYPGDDIARPKRSARSVRLSPAPVARGHNLATIGLIGSGNYASSVLIPAFQAAGVRMHSIASAAGVSSVHWGRKFGFEHATTDVDTVFENAEINVAVIATRHDTHAALALQAQERGKHVFVEKPLCLALSELDRLHSAFRESKSILMVGFNRRFSPLIVKLKTLLNSVPGEKAFVMMVNAGAIPLTHWAHDREVGGGRVLGEACHFIDLLRYLADSPIVKYDIAATNAPGRDVATITLRFEDGSLGSIHYLANGSKAFPKERLEVFASGRVVQLDNFRRMRGFGWPGFSRMSLWRQDKGQKACVHAFVEAVRNGAVAPIPLAEIVEVSRVTIELQNALR